MSEKAKVYLMIALAVAFLVVFFPGFLGGLIEGIIATVVWTAICFFGACLIAYIAKVLFSDEDVKFNVNFK